jgi:DNA repair exonuclease SbcCD nuclease subunit
MKFIHTADIHLDSPLRGLSAYPDAPAERLRTATRDAFGNLITRAIDEAVDFMVIAGDVYDGDWKDFNTGLFFVRQMGRLRQAGIAVYLLYGNHDAESEMTRSLELPDNVRVFSSRRGETFRIEALQVALHGRSFKLAATSENLLPSYPEPVPGWLNIGVLHTALEGNAKHARYAPCSLAELQTKGYQYWALGHVHDYWLQRGEVTIAYPGNLQGRHIRECGAHGALLVSAEHGEICALERLEVDVLRWHALDVDISQADGASAAVRLVGQQIARLLEDMDDQRPLALRVTLSGSSAAHRELLGQEQQLRQDVIAQAVALDPERLWIEKVVLASSASQDTGRAPLDAEAADALLELESLAQSALADDDFLNALQQEMLALLEKLPLEVLQAQAELKALRQDPAQHLPALLQQSLTQLMAQLQGHPAADARLPDRTP